MMSKTDIGVASCGFRSMRYRDAEIREMACAALAKLGENWPRLTIRADDIEARRGSDARAQRGSLTHVAGPASL